MAVCCWSLTGLPFTIGFFGKFFLIKPALQAASVKGAEDVKDRMIWLVVLLVVNAAISAAYYLKIIAAMFLRAEPVPFSAPARSARPEPEPEFASSGRQWPIIAGVTLSVIGTILFGIFLPATNRLWDRSQTADINGIEQPAPAAAKVVSAR